MGPRLIFKRIQRKTPYFGKMLIKFCHYGVTTLVQNMDSSTVHVNDIFMNLVTLMFEKPSGSNSNCGIHVGSTGMDTNCKSLIFRLHIKVLIRLLFSSGSWS